MKNPLADVIRQASGGDHALSDSGSFDTRNAELGATANDEDIDVASTEELELLESTGAIVLDGGTVSFEHPIVSPTDEARDEYVFDVERAPFAARFAPLICLAAALLITLVWSAYTSLDMYATQSSVGMGMDEMPVQVKASIAGTVQIEGAERFPFIDPEARSAEGDSP